MDAALSILVLLLVGAVLLPLARIRRARRQMLAKLALRRGWTYHPVDSWQIASEIDNTCLGAWGHDHACCDVFSVPTRSGSLWLGEFTRQIASGRWRRTERYALAMAHLPVGCGGIADLPAESLFVPTDPFACYRPVRQPATPAGRQVWAERPTSDRAAIGRLADLVGHLPDSAAAEARGALAAVYWPLSHRARVRDVIELHRAGERLLRAFTPPADGESP